MFFLFCEVEKMRRYRGKKEDSKRPCHEFHRYLNSVICLLSTLFGIRDGEVEKKVETEISSLATLFHGR